MQQLSAKGTLVSAKSTGNRGISLLEVALFLVIAGAVLIGGFKLYETRSSYERGQATAEQMATIKDAIEKYRTAGEGALPCVASPTDSPEMPNYGKPLSQCMDGGVLNGTVRHIGANGLYIRIGSLPVRALGLPDSAMIDGWGNRIVYAVTEGMAMPNPPKSRPGAMTIQDSSGHSISSTNGNVVYLAFSPGEDKRGAYNINGKIIEPCDTSSIAGENCDGDAVFTMSSQKNTNKENALTSLFIYGTKSKRVTPENSIVVNPMSGGTCVPGIEAETSDCPANPPDGSGFPANYVLVSGSIIRQHSLICPDMILSDWVVVSNTCKWKDPADVTTDPNCPPASETKTVPCPDHPPASTGLPAEYIYVSGEITQKRDTQCPSGSWGNWYEASSTCSWKEPPPSQCEVIGSCTASIGYQIVCGKYVLLNTNCPGSPSYSSDGGFLSSNDELIELQPVSDIGQGDVDCSANGIPICGANYCSKSEQVYNICQYETPPENGGSAPPPIESPPPASYAWKWSAGDDKSCHDQLDTDDCSCAPDSSYGSTMSEAYCQRSDGVTVSNGYCQAIYGDPPGGSGDGTKTSACSQCPSYRCP